MPKYQIQERLDWAWWVTPKLLKDKPVHRWYVFPHSFASELVHALIDEWGLTQEDHILDPFAGAGTTLLAAKEKGISATGYDLSPLAVLASRTKLANLSLARLSEQWNTFKRFLRKGRFDSNDLVCPEFVRKALPGRLLGTFRSIDHYISSLSASGRERDFFRVALLSVLPRFSRAMISGGWPKWIKSGPAARAVPAAFAGQVESMLRDLRQTRFPRRTSWSVDVADARRLPVEDDSFTAVITSPPYPNRHDYTRVFGLELMFSLLDWEQTRDLRYQSFHSHPEARPSRPEINGYVPPRALTKVLSVMRKTDSDPRVIAMLEGYFLDMYLFLREVRRVCRQDARIAVVLGNGQYYGIPILVDEWTAEVAERVGLGCERIVAVRYRGNSAQQMGRYGRRPSRESVVLFRRSICEPVSVCASCEPS
jgi:site-specific DNA-methyltransferase (cytosine-N4-specific)